MQKSFDLDTQEVLECMKSLDTKKLVPPKKNKRTQLPGQPERARTAYIFFSSEIRSTLTNDNGESLAFAEAGRVIGAKWHDLTEEEKKKYTELANADRKRYEDEMKVFDPKYKPKNLGKKEEKTELEKHRDGVKGAKEKSVGGAIYCHNLSTSRTIKYQADKPSPDKVWDVSEHLCANSQADLDTWSSQLVGKKSKKTVKAEVPDDVSDFDDEEEKPVLKTKVAPKVAGGRKKKEVASK